MTLRPRPRDEAGFTFIELLVVIILIGILAAIVLPMLLGQKPKAEDATAKSDVRLLVSYVEACRADQHDYDACDTSVELSGTPGVDWGSGPGQVRVVSATADSYVAEGVARSGNAYRWTRPASGPVSRTCTADGGGSGLCSNGTW